jgi:hypothetical protein
VPFLVAGTAGKYDLPDLMAALAPRRLLIINPRKGDGTIAPGDEIHDETSFVAETYREKNHGKYFRVTRHPETKDADIQIIGWLESEHK